MKLEFQAKFLQHLNKKRKQEEGFTLIELLVVIIIIGILAAIALPSLLAQVNKAKQAEAKQNVGALNRAQQAYFLEQTAFASDIVSLGVGIQSQSVNYSYLIRVDNTSQIAQNLGARLPNKNTLKSYVGLNYTSLGGGGAAGVSNTEVLSLGRVCETTQPKDLNGLAAPAPNQSGCPQGYKDLGTGKSS
jgi:type IV pilus assembly protein PilA